MPIVSTDIEYRLSGGAANADVDASLGGAKSSVQVGAGTHNLFDAVDSAEAAAGDVEYRALYVHNDHATLTMLNAVLWIQSNTPSGDSALAVGLGTSTVNAVEQVVAAESNAPAGVTFVAAADESGAIALGDIPAGEHRAFWLRRTITAAAGAYTDDGATIRTKCDTLA